MINEQPELNSTSTVAVGNETEKIEKKSIVNWAKKHKTKLIIGFSIVTTIAISSLIEVAIASGKIDREQIENYKKMVDVFSNERKNETNTNLTQELKPLVAEKMNKRYTVQAMAFKTGQWYDKTNTDNKAAAYSVAKGEGFGRKTRIIDNATGEIDNILTDESCYPNYAS